MTKKGSLEDALQGKGVHVDSENRIWWDEDAEQHPRNWKAGTKTYTAALICWLEMYMTAISSSGVSLVTHGSILANNVLDGHCRLSKRGVWSKQNTGLFCICYYVSFEAYYGFYAFADFGK